MRTAKGSAAWAPVWQETVAKWQCCHWWIFPATTTLKPSNGEETPMEMLLFLLVIFLLLDVAAVRGWAPDTRDARDWNVPSGLR